MYFDDFTLLSEYVFPNCNTFFLIGADDRTRFNLGSHQFSNWWQQYATGILQFLPFESVSIQKKRKPYGLLFFGALAQSKVEPVLFAETSFFTSSKEMVFVSSL